MMMLTFDGFEPDIEATENEQLYLFVDGGQVKEIAKTLYQIPGQLDLEPIFMYPPYDDIMEVSPYIIKVTDEVKAWFLAQNNVTSGFFFSSSQPLDEVCDYYRQFIQVLSPYNSKVFLKWRIPKWRGSYYNVMIRHFGVACSRFGYQRVWAGKSWSAQRKRNHRH